MILCGVTGYVVTPWQGNVRNFSPEVLAERETKMWRHYYEKRFVALGFGLYRTARDQFGISPWQASRMAWDLASAAKVFQRSHSRREAQKALPYLELAYGRLARCTGANFNIPQAAALELDWWQLRREHAPAELYAQTISALAREIYSLGDDPRIHQAASQRARAMAYRDAHRKTGMRDEDWKIVEKGLRDSYGQFHAALAPP